MNSNKKTGRLVGILFLFIFVMGVTMYQFLQAPLFTDDFLTATSTSANQIIISIVLGIISGATSVVVAILLLPIFKRHNVNLAYIYFAFCILYFVAIAIDNASVFSLLELSKAFVSSGGENSDSYEIMGALLYGRHWWTHYLSLLTSCLPVFVLYCSLYLFKLVPSTISIFGMFAVILMFTEQLASIFGHSISMDMLLPMGLIQLILPIWLIIKGFNSPKESTE